MITLVKHYIEHTPDGSGAGNSLLAGKSQKDVKTNDTSSRILRPFVDAFMSIGFRENQIIQQYEFVDLRGHAETQRVDLGVFGREPFDYKSACFAVHILPEGLDVGETAKSFRSLGASQFFIVVNGSTQRWLNSQSAPELRESFPTRDAPNLILSNRNHWNPDTMLRMRSGFQQPKPEQIDFVDIGLIPALEREASQKIDSLIRGILHTAEIYSGGRGRRFDAQDMFKTLFRLLTAKLLADRGVDIEGGIDFSKPLETLNAVNDFYKVKDQDFSKYHGDLLPQISSRIGESFSFKNLSVDTLTYVYENTFVSERKRKELGIHSTPSYLADFIVANLPIEEFPSDKWNLIDPMCGHGIFLIAGMRRFRDLLPANWSGHRRHDFFTSHIRGIEIDHFAYEVARMCLTLADFPQPDGWDIRQQNAFEGSTLGTMVRESTIVVGNPPFEDLPKTLPKTPKPKELLRRILPIMPFGGLIGVVLPKSFLSGDNYKNERKYLLEEFAILNITELPEGVFSHATVETCVVTARKGRPKQKTKHFIVDRPSRDLFQSKQYIPYVDELEQDYFALAQQGRMIVPILRELWEHLAQNPRLGKYVTVHKGVEYQLGLISEHRKDVVRDQPFKNSQPGLWNVTDDFLQFTVQTKEYLSLDKRHWRNRHSRTWRLPWTAPKVIVPASRLSQGHWRFAAVVDGEGLIVGRRFYAMWSKTDNFSLELLGAFLNSPLAQAYCLTHSFQQDTRARVYESIPLPNALQLPNTLIGSLVKSYVEYSGKRQYEEANKTLLQIDAQILKLYQLSPRLERKLLDFFWGHKRRVPFNFSGYIPPTFESWIPLHVYISKEYQESTIRDTLRRLPTITNEPTIRYFEELGCE